MAASTMHGLAKMSPVTMTCMRQRSRNGPLPSFSAPSFGPVASGGQAAAVAFPPASPVLGSRQQRNVSTSASRRFFQPPVNSAISSPLSTMDDYDFVDDPQHKMAPYPRTSMICTVGPASQDRIGELVEAGMRIMRLNFSHGSHEYQTSLVNKLREYLDDRDQGSRSLDYTTGITVNCAVAFDLKGPEIRTGMLSGDDDVPIEAGGDVLLSMKAEDLEAGTRIDGGAVVTYIDYPKLPEAVAQGSTVFIDDGLLNLTVTEIGEDWVKCKAINSGKLGGRKGVNLPGAILDLPAVSDKDRDDIRLGAELGVDFIFASFVRKAEHVEEIRQILVDCGSPNTRIISKIENQEGLDNFDEILRETDGVMVARGDLGIEIPAQKVVTAQKKIIQKCNIAGKPVVCATQMLESMTTSPRPTRAEVSDVANAVLDGADCVMLSGETAKGLYPIEAIMTMGEICREADTLIDYNSFHERLRFATRRSTHRTIDSIAAAAVKCASDEQAAMIVVVTHNGNAGRYISKYRPPMPVLAVTTSEMVARQSFIYRGLTPLFVDEIEPCLVSLDSTDERGLEMTEYSGAEACDNFRPASYVPEDVIERAIEYGRAVNILQEGDTVVAVVASTQVGASAMRVLTVGSAFD